MEHYFYKTDSTLLCVVQTKDLVLNHVPSMNGNTVVVDKQPRFVFTKKHLKLSLFNGRLYVKYGRESTDSSVERPFQNFSEFFHPELGGTIVSYISMDMIEPIEEFLNLHFSHIDNESVDALSPVYDIDDLPTFDSKMSEADVKRICALAYRIINTAFPVASKFVRYCMSDGFYKMSTKHLILMPHHRALTYKEFVTQLFGVYRKDLMKAVMKHGLDAVEWVSCFRGLVPDDYLISSLNECPKTVAYADVSCNLDFHLLNDFPYKVVKSLIADGLKNIEVDSFIVRDALEMCVNIPKDERSDIRTWKDLHDSGMGNFRLRVADGTVSIEFIELFIALFDDLQTEYNIRPLSHAKDFVEIGNRMKLCINRSLSYVNRAYNGEGVYFLLSGKDDKDMVASKESVLVEITKNNSFMRKTFGRSSEWTVDQVYGYDNSSKNSNYYRKIVVEKLGQHHSENFTFDK